MKTRRILITTLLSLAMVSGGLGGVLVYAESNSTSGSSTTTNTATKKTNDPEAIQAMHNADLMQKGLDSAAAARTLAESRLNELKAKVEVRTKEVRTKACEDRKTAVSNRLENLYDNGQKHKQAFDKILDRINAFVTKKNLTVVNGDTLKANIVTAADKVTTEAATLNALKGNIDCSNPDSVATGLEAFKTQADVLRDALKSYREAIRAYLKAVKTAAESAEKVTDAPKGTN